MFGATPMLARVRGTGGSGGGAVIVVALLATSCLQSAITTAAFEPMLRQQRRVNQSRPIQQERAATALPFVGASALFRSQLASLSSRDAVDKGRHDEAVIQHPVLRQVYPLMLEHNNTYGNVNIPLKTSGGRLCQKLQQLHIAGKLTDAEVELLDRLGFIFYSLEDVARHGDFDALLQRLQLYKHNHENEPPKKYAPDPELGAWVTGLRRLGPEQLPGDRVQRLNDIDFHWTSPRQCGSAFMQHYRDAQAQLQAAAGWPDAATQRWIRAQQDANARGALSATRQHYMEQLLGNDWAEQSFAK